MRTGDEPLLALYIWRGGPLCAEIGTIGNAEGRADGRAIMLQGTGSDVGKTVLVAGLCRAAQKPRPEGAAVQAAEHVEQRRRRRHPGETAAARSAAPNGCRRSPAACRATVDMNPVLLKPQSEIGAQVIVQGKVFGEAQGARLPGAEAAG